MPDNRVIVAVDLLTQVDGSYRYAGVNQLLPAYSSKRSWFSSMRTIKSQVRIYSAAWWGDTLWTDDARCIHPIIDPSAMVGYGAGCTIIELGTNSVVGWQIPYGHSKKIPVTLRDMAKVHMSSVPLPKSLAIPTLWCVDESSSIKAYVHGKGIVGVREVPIPFSIEPVSSITGDIVGCRMPVSNIAGCLNSLMHAYCVTHKIDALYIGRVQISDPVTDTLIEPSAYNTGMRSMCETTAHSDNWFAEGVRALNAQAVKAYRSALLNLTFDTPPALI